MALTQRHTIYIRCRAPELWAALTEGQTSRQYYFDSIVESSFEPGAAIRYVVEPENDAADQTIITALEGEIVSVEPERSLVHTFRFSDLDEPATTVRWTLAPQAAPGVIRVDVHHDGFEAESEAWHRIDSGWPIILSGLKTWLETGTSLGVLGGGPPESEHIA